MEALEKKKKQLEKEREALCVSSIEESKKSQQMKEAS